MINIRSYESINHVAFGSDELSVLATFASPQKRVVNREQEQELHFPGFVLRFDAQSNGLRECTLLPRCDGTINGTPIMWTDQLLHWLAMEDHKLQHCVGFIVSLKLGIMVSGFHDHDGSQKAIHAFKKGDMDMFLDRMRPFKLHG
jgi:hypothetical protein